MNWAHCLTFPGREGPFSKTGNFGNLTDNAVLGYNADGYYLMISSVNGTITVLFAAGIGAMLKSARQRAENLKILALGAVTVFGVGFCTGAESSLSAEPGIPSITAAALSRDTPTLASRMRGQGRLQRPEKEPVLPLPRIPRAETPASQIDSSDTFPFPQVELHLRHCPSLRKEVGWSPSYSFLRITQIRG